MKRFELEKTALQEELQRVKVEKAETCTALRNEFGDALASRDKVVNSLKGKLDTLKFEKQESEEQYEKICRELRSSLKENIDNNKKLEEEAMKSNISLENVNTELAKVRREKDSIGNTIRSEFDHICSGLRMDLENTLKEKEEIYRALEVGRLGLEKELVEKEETVDGLMQLVKVKDEISDGEKAESLKAELERFKRDLSGMHVKLGQEKKVVEQKNAVIQTLEDDRKRLLSERDEALAKAQQEVATISSLKDHVLQNLESKLSETAKAHVMLSEKYEEVEREFQTVVEHIVSSVQESTDDSSVLELLEKECPTAKDKRVRCNLVVSQVIDNWMETRGCIEKESRKWRAEEEGYKLEIENLTKEKQESCEEIKNKLLTNLEEKDEQLEGLASQLNKSRNENERIKEDSLCKIKELKETLDNGHNSHLVEKAKMMEKLKDAALQIQGSEKELAKLRKRIEMDEQEIKILNEEKHSLQEMTKEFDSIVAEKKEEADSLRRDLDVVQNERNHFEQSLIKNVDCANDDFNELLTILGQDKLCEIQDVPKKKNKLLDVVSLLVKEVEKNGDLHNKLKEEKTKICQEIREQFETTLHEKENILEELGVKLRDLHKECSKLKAENEEKNNEMTELRSKLSGLPDAENINEANKRALSEMGSKTREEIKLVEVDAQERDQITKGVVENVLAERLEKPLEAPLLVDFTENENVLRNEISKLTEQNTSLKEEVENLQNIYNERNSQTCQLVEDVIALREENNSLKRALELSTLEQSQLSSIKEENETIRQDIENLQIANKNLKDKVELSRTQVKEDSRGENAEKTEVELMAIIRDKELVNQRLEENLMECTKNVNQLKDELARAGKERLEYERLRRDFDHIVSGLRGDLERALSDREDKSRMLDELRTHVGDIREKDSSEERAYDAHGTSSDTIEKELEDVKVRLREMTLVNRQLKQLGKSLKAELKETRRDKQHSEKKCQDLRNEMESFVKDKEATIMESRERMETSERMFNKKVDDLRKEYDDKIREIASNKKYSTHDYNELQSVNEELQIKLNDAYEEINNIAQIEETNVMLKQEIETMRLQNGSLMEKVEELKDVINEADEQIELRDNRLKELQENLQGMNDEKLQIEQQLHEITVNLDNQVQVEAGRDGMLETMSNLGKEGKEPVTDGGDDVAKNNVYLSQYSQALEVTSESAKLQRELMQTSPDRSQDEIKQPSDQSYSKDKENHIKVLEQQLEQTQKSKALTELDLEKSRKISAKLKSMVKNSRTEVETLRDDLVSAKNDTLQKEQAMQRLRTDMADLVKEKEKLVEKLMTRLRASDLDKDESINNLRYKYEVILKKRKADLEEVSRELNETSSRADELKAQLDMWRSSYNDVCEKNNELEIELRNMRNILDHSVAEHNRTKETSSKRINEADKTIEELTERLRKKTQDFENSEKYKSEVEENLVLRAQMDSNMTSKDSVIDDLQKELQVAKESLQRAQTELQEKSIGFESLWQQREKSEERFLSYQEEVNGSLSKKDKVIRKLEDDLQNANENIHDIAKKLKEKSDHCDVAQTEKDVLQLCLNETQKESENATLVQEEVIADATRNLDAANGRVEELLKKLNETSLMLIMERNRKEELDEISATLRKDLELRTEQKRELEDVVMNLNMDLEKALRDREELRQALRVKQTVTQGCDNACFDEEILLEKEKEISVLEVKFEEKEKEVSAMNQKLNDVQMVHQDLSYEHEKTKEVFQKTLANHQNERKRLEETIAQLQQELQQTLCTKEEAVNVLRMKLEEAVEERGDLASSLKSEYDKMLTEKDERITRLQEDVHRVNEEFTNLGYRFELTLQDNVNKGNAIVQLQNELKEKARIVEENSRLQLRLESMVQRINELEKEMDHLKDETNKSDAQKLFEELQNTKAMVKALEKQLTSIRKECEVSKAKQKKEFKRLSEALQFDLEHCRKQNLEKEKSLQNLRVELEEVVKQKEALFQRLRTPTKVKSVERLQKAADETLGFADGNLVEKLREEKTELLRDLEKARQQKDEIFTKFHHISDGLRRDLEEAINMRDQKVQESLEVNIMLDKVDRENTELRTQLKEKETIISKLTANLEKKGERNDLMMEQLRAENEKVKTALAQELMNSRQNILKTHNANEELKQSLVKAEFDRENLRNYIATKELQSEELKRQLVREVAARKRVSEELRAEGMKNVEETFLESSLENFESFNKTRNECDEVSIKTRFLKALHAYRI